MCLTHDNYVSKKVNGRLQLFYDTGHCSDDLEVKDLVAKTITDRFCCDDGDDGNYYHEQCDG